MFAGYVMCFVYFVLFLTLSTILWWIKMNIYIYRYITDTYSDWLTFARSLVSRLSLHTLNSSVAVGGRFDSLIFAWNSYDGLWTGLSSWLIALISGPIFLNCRSINRAVTYTPHMQLNVFCMKNSKKMFKWKKLPLIQTRNINTPKLSNNGAQLL